jgi:signal transduction histidine kinase
MSEATKEHFAAQRALPTATCMTAEDSMPVSGSRVRWARLAFAAFGVVLAVTCLVVAWKPEDVVTYAFCSVFLAASLFFTLPVPPPGMVLPVPYFAMMSAFGYIAGFPVIGIDYLLRVPAYPVIYALVRRGLMNPPGYMRSVIATFAERRPLLNDDHVDDWALLAVGAAGFATRIAAFQILTGVALMNPIAAIACAELVGYGCNIVVNLILPLPTSQWVLDIVSRRTAVASDEPLDPRLDEMIAFILCDPPLVFLIVYGYTVHGLPGAAIWSASTLGLHNLLRLLTQRRALLVEQQREIEAASQRLQLANQQLGAKALALEEKQEELRDFVYTVTHDLKNPLGAIQITADLLRESDAERLSGEGRDHLDRMVRLASHTDEMICDLMEFFKITSTPEPSGWVDLRSLVERTLDTLAPQIVSKGVRVEVGELARVWGQSAKLGHVVANLIGNAVKYVPKDRGVVQVEAAVRNGYIRLSVQDNGIGIARAYQQGIFDLFGRVPVKEQQVDGGVTPGTGVGLAIVKRIVEAHAGRAWVESEPGAGAAFFVELPAGQGVGALGE